VPISLINTLYYVTGELLSVARDHDTINDVYSALNVVTTESGTAGTKAHSKVRLSEGLL
jgi:hypothetical protein